jgi:predicted amidohydrolase
MKYPRGNRIRVASAQYFIRPISSFSDFADQVSSAVATAQDYRCRLLVMPEYLTTQLMSLTDVHRPVDELVRDVAGYLPQYIDLMSGLAKKHSLYLVGGTIPTVTGDGRVCNDAYLFSPSGEYGIQGKLHMTRFEREDWKVSARGGVKIFETDFGRMGIAICYDVEFPEVVRAMALEGVHILAVPSSTDDRQGFLRVRYCAHARTIENQLYVVHSPTVGSLPSVPDAFLNYGQASILTPLDYTFSRDGILAEGVLNQEMIIVGELDMSTIEESRTFGTVLPLLDSHHTKELISTMDVVTL